MKKTIVRNGKRIKGFVYENSNGYWYAFGKPSQNNYISFQCRDIEHGIACIEVHTINH